MTTGGAQYISSGFNVDKITIGKNLATAPFGGIGELIFKSSFQQENNSFRLSSFNEFAMDFSFGKISDQFGSKIKILRMPEFSCSVGTYMENVLIMGSKAGVNTIKNEVKNDIKSVEEK